MMRKVKVGLYDELGDKRRFKIHTDKSLGEIEQHIKKMVEG